MRRDEFEALLRRQLDRTVADPANMADKTLDVYLAPHRTAMRRAWFFEHQVRHPITRTPGASSLDWIG